MGAGARHRRRTFVTSLAPEVAREFVATVYVIATAGSVLPSEHSQRVDTRIARQASWQDSFAGGLVSRAGGLSFGAACDTEASNAQVSNVQVNLVDSMRDYLR
jgi:hypothetical protein